MSGNIFGLCGYIGSGKSSYARSVNFLGDGVITIDCDYIAKELIHSNMKCRLELGEFFRGYKIPMFVNGVYNKEAIGNLLFGTSKVATPTPPIYFFNKILQPYLVEKIQKVVDEYADDVIIMIEAATLHSSELSHLCDSIIYVHNKAPLEDICNGVMKRSNMSRPMFHNIYQYQTGKQCIRNPDHTVYFTGTTESDMKKYKEHFHSITKKA